MIQFMSYHRRKMDNFSSDSDRSYDFLDSS